MSELDKIPGFLEFLEDSIVIFGDRAQNKKPISSETIHNFMLDRFNEALTNISTELSCRSVVNGTIPCEPSNWVEGIPCEVLKPGHKWEKGQVVIRITAEFVPDEEVVNKPEKTIEPSLDEFRE